jgi:hypothetical protein
VNVSTLTPEQAWRMTLDQVRLDMTAAAFDTWVSSTHFVAFHEGIFTIGTPNAYGRDWLASRLAATVNRLLTGILDQPVEVQFTVMEELPESPDEADLLGEEAPVPEQNPKVLSLQAEYQSVYDEIVHPDQVIVVPGYFLRYIPLLGPELAWLYVGFRQAAYEAGGSRRPEKQFNAPSKKVAHYAGMSLRAFWRWVARPDTWSRLRGLVTQVDSPAHWSQGKDGRPHQSARAYRVAMTLPLTPLDERSLRAWLYQQLARGKPPLAVLEKALETPPDEQIPWPEPMAFAEAITTEPHSVQEVIAAVCGPVPDSQRSQFQELSDRLAQYLIPPNDLIFLTHYFVTHWIPELGPGSGWLVTLLRDRGYINPRTGESRDEVILPGGYAEAASHLGIKRVKTIWEWLKSSAAANFVHEMGREAGSWEDAPRRFKVCLGEPLTDADQKQASQRMGIQVIGANGIYRPLFHKLPERTRLFRLFVTHSEWTRRFLVEPSLLSVIDCYGIELIHPVREARSDAQIGKKGLSNKLWIVGGKLCWILNHRGLVVDWDFNTANVHDTSFQPLIQQYVGRTAIFSDCGFHAKEGDPENLKVCKPYTHNERMLVETALSLLTTVCHFKKVFHRTWDQFQARLAFTMATYTLLISWNGFISPLLNSACDLSTSTIGYISFHGQNVH